MVCNILLFDGANPQDQIQVEAWGLQADVLDSFKEDDCVEISQGKVRPVHDRHYTSLSHPYSVEYAKNSQIVKAVKPPKALVEMKYVPILTSLQNTRENLCVTICGIVMSAEEVRAMGFGCFDWVIMNEQESICCVVWQCIYGWRYCSTNFCPGL